MSEYYDLPYTGAEVASDLAKVHDKASLVEEAPTDGKEYVRKDGVWTENQHTKITETLLLNLKSNQSTTDGSLNGLVVHVQYVDEDIELTWQGSELVVEVPLAVSYTVTFPSCDGYSTPDTRTFTAIAGNVRNVEGAYNTEVVSVTLSTDTAASCVGQVVTINGTDYTWQGTAISVKIPFGTEYTISVNALSGYNTPASVTYTACQATREVALQYVELKVSYITINQTITDPATMISGDVNGNEIQWIRNNTHRVLGKQTASGTVTYCRLSDTDGTKYYDGTTATLTGSEGDVFVKLPTFYYKATETSTDVWQIGFARSKPDDTWKTWDGNDLIGAYEAYNSSSKLYSRSGVVSTGSVSQADFKTYARARGTGYTLVKWKHHCMIAFLFYALYGNTNCQAICGAGTDSYTKQTGGTNALGMEDTVAGGNGDSGSINFLGLENGWGNKYEFIDNVVVDKRVWKVTEDDGTVRQAGTGGSSSDYISKVLIGENLDMIPTAVDGDSTKGYCDYYYQSSNSGRVVARSGYGSSTYGGVAYARAYYDSSLTDTFYGSRLAFRGNLVEAESVSAFKALSAIG